MDEGTTIIATMIQLEGQRNNHYGFRNLVLGQNTLTVGRKSTAWLLLVGRRYQKCSLSTKKASPTQLSKVNLEEVASHDHQIGIHIYRCLAIVDNWMLLVPSYIVPKTGFSIENKAIL